MPAEIGLMVVKQFLGGMNGCFKPVHVEFGVFNTSATHDMQSTNRKGKNIGSSSSQYRGKWYSQEILFSDFAGNKTDFEGWMTNNDFELIRS